jgi:TonB family protein
MKLLAALLMLASAVYAQTQPRSVLVSSTEATSHLLKSPAPVYPPAAQLARIQGNVVLEVIINEKGAPTVVRVVRGHPMLTTAARDAVERWVYQPFGVNGVPTPVVTLVMVTFGQPYHDKEERMELMVEDDIRFASVFASQGNYTEADARFNHAKQILAEAGGASGYAQWSLSMAIGSVRTEQKKYDEAEQSYKDAVNAYTGVRYPSENAAESLIELSNLYLSQKRYADARQALTQSADILESVCKKGQCSGDSRKVIHRKLTHAYVDLSKIAVLEGNAADAVDWCAKVLKEKKSLDDSEREAMLSTCDDATKKAAGK